MAKNENGNKIRFTDMSMLDEYEKIMVEEVKFSERNSSFCQICGKPMLTISGTTQEDRDFEVKNSVHVDCYRSRKMDQAEKQQQHLSEVEKARRQQDTMLEQQKRVSEIEKARKEQDAKSKKSK